MNREEPIYDIGDIQLDPPLPPPAPRPVLGRIPVRPQRTTERTTERRAARRDARQDLGGVGPGLAGSLSMFVPGLGQMVEGETAWGLFYLTGTGFCAASLWALIGTLDRLVPTLRLLDVPREVLVVAVSSLALLAMSLHLAGVVHAQIRARPGGDSTAAHPIVAGLASLLIPGWGQLLAGHRCRATLFLCGVWCLSAAWLVVTPAGTLVLARLGIRLPAAVLEGWGPVVMLSAPIVLGVIAVYDAAAGASAERKR